MARTKADVLSKARKIALGSNNRKGIVPTTLVYIVLLCLGFTYILPLLQMIVTVFMTPQDLVDPKVIWVPTSIYFDGVKTAFTALRYGEGLFVTAALCVVPAFLQTICTALAGYAFGRFEFPLKKFWLLMVIAFYVVPIQITLIPRYMMFMQYKIIETPWAAYLPALFGQGLKSGIFILIFYQFFSSYPKSLDEAAEIDGCGRFKVFYRIALPMSGPAMVISVIFSVVWYWNETAQPQLYYARAKNTKLFGIDVLNLQSLPYRVITFVDRYKEEFSAQTGPANATVMAAGLLAILPILILYFVLQKRFVESVERSGITGE